MKKKFEFFNQFELDHLEQLKKDRHACAHPAFVSDEALFPPSPELVRAHIVHAIDYLLKHKPVQGKAALDKILYEMKQTSFPENIDDVSTFLENRFLNKAKDVLIRNFAIILVKTLLKSTDDDFNGKENRVVNALKAIKLKHHAIYEDVIKEQIKKIEVTLEENQLLNIFRLLKADQACWHLFDKATQVKVKKNLSEVFKEEGASNTFFKYNVFSSINLEESLSPTIIKAFEKLNPRDQEKIIVESIDSPHPILIEKAVELFIKSSNNESVNFIGLNMILPLSRALSSEQINKILLQGVKNNERIAEAEKAPEILERLFEKTIDKLDKTRGTWQATITFLMNISNAPEYNEKFFNLIKRLENYNIYIKSEIEIESNMEGEHNE